MRTYLKVAGALLVACGLLLAFTFTADAGEYYRRGYHDGGYYGHRHNPRYSSVWYTSSCCYRKIVRHSRSVRYVRKYRHQRYYHSSRYYDGDRYYRGGYYDTHYYSRPYGRYGDYGGRSYRRARYADYHEYGSGGCYTIRVRVGDYRSGVVWVRRRVCN